MTVKSPNVAQNFESGEEVIDLAVAGQPQREDGKPGTSHLDSESMKLTIS